MAGAYQPAFTVYTIENYNFGVKDAVLEKDATMEARQARLAAKWEREGLRRTVEGVLLVHEHNHPHLLLVQMNSLYFKLPGGRLRPGEDEVAGLRRKLANTLSPTSANLVTDWQVGECIGTFWRPSFEPHMYPYLPAHVTKPKEMKKLYVVPLPERCYFAVPKNMKLLAVPLFELYGNLARYGPVIAAIPQMVSRFKLNLAGTPRPQLMLTQEPHQQDQLSADAQEVYG